MSMRWFRYYCNFPDQPVSLAIHNEFGLHGEAALMRIMGKVAAVYNDVQCPTPPIPAITLTPREWGKMTEFSPKKLQKFLDICEKSDFFLTEKSEKTIRISIPILLNLLGKGKKGEAEKSKFLVNKNPQGFATDKQQVEPEEEKRQNNTVNALSPLAEKAARKVLRDRNIDPDSHRGEYCLDYAARNAKDNPAGYIVNTLRNDPNFGIDENIIPALGRNNEPKHIGDCLRNLLILNKNGVSK